MAIKIEILSVKTTTQPGKKAGTSYQVLEAAYKNLTFQDKVEGRKIMSFGATGETFKTLATAQAGDVFEIEVVKNNAGFNDWVSAKKSANAQTTGSGSAGVSRTTPATPTPKSTYETPEERAKKQIYIVRQSSISSAIALLSVGSKSSPKVDEVISTAKQFEDYVFGTQPSDPTAGDVSNFDDLESDVPM